MSHRSHKAKVIALKMAAVDEGIIPVVQFLNEFSGIWTIWSCQGDELSNDDDSGYYPYVTFFVEEMTALRSLLHYLRGAPCEVVIEPWTDYIPFRFAINFADRNHLDTFVKWIKSKNKSN